MHSRRIFAARRRRRARELTASFVNSDAMALVTLFLATIVLSAAADSPGRPNPSSRRFVSPAVDSAIDALAAKMKNHNLATIFSNALPNTLDTTVQVAGPSDTFIITGDITAMWQRDSTNQVLPYLRYVQQDAKLKGLFQGLIRRQVNNLLTDPYANSFKFSATSSPSPHLSDSTTAPSFLGTTVDAMGPMIFERKYELDSLVHVLKLSYEYVAASNDTSVLDDAWVSAIELAIQTMRDQQAGFADEGQPPYIFQRTTPQPTDSLSHGRGTPVKRTGMVRSAFRPSDDATTYQFNIPANAMASVYLNRSAQLLDLVGKASLASEARALAQEIAAAIEAHGVIQHPTAGQVYAYEVDGYGNALFMDDANVPSLLSLPYLGWCAPDDTLYKNTRKAVLSGANPYFFNGTAGEGVGGPHNGYGYVWPMSIMMRALTSTDEAEVASALSLLEASTAGTGFMHESFWKDSVGQYTRPWFAWANSLFGELILTVADRYPGLLF